MLDKIMSILREEIIPAEGCTEPIALAYAGSKLRDILGGIPEKIDIYLSGIMIKNVKSVKIPNSEGMVGIRDILGGIPEKIDIYLSGNMIKNVKSVKIPNSEGMVGIEAAIAMGTILGDSKKELMVISGVDKTKLPEVKKYLDENRMNISGVDKTKLPEVKKYLNENRMNVLLYHGDVKLYIKLVGTLGEDEASIEIQNYHTNITEIIKNGEKILGQSCDDRSFVDTPMTDRSFLTMDLIYNTAKTIDINLIEPIFKKVIEFNTAIAKEGLTNLY